MLLRVDVYLERAAKFITAAREVDRLNKEKEAEVHMQDSFCCLQCERAEPFSVQSEAVDVLCPPSKWKGTQCAEKQLALLNGRVFSEEKKIVVAQSFM